MRYGGENNQPFVPLILIYFTALSLRLVATLILGGMPFWDSYAHYNLVVYYLQTHDGAVFQQAHLGFYSLNIVITTFTGIPVLAYARFFPPFFDSLTILPIYLLTKEILRNKRSALVASLFFAVTDIVVLRQSYLIPEGFAIYFMALIFFLILKTVYSSKFWKFLILSCISFYCLCSFHNLTSAMTFFPLVTTLLIILLSSFRILKPFSVPIVDPTEFRNFLSVAIAFSFIWIFWAKETQFIGFLAHFVSLDITGMTDFLTRQREPTPEVFMEHHITTQQITFLDLAAMASGSVLIFFMAVFGFLKLIRSRHKDFRLYFLLIWTLTMISNFLLNFLLDSMFGASASGQQAYRAWIFMIIPLIIITSKSITAIKNKLIFQAILASSLLVLSVGAIWFVGYLMESFPHATSPL